MKKLLAMVLALVMTLSLAVSANAAFEDAKDINATYAEAVDVLAGMKVFQGYDNGKTFKPQGDITRAEVAAIVYRIYTADVKDSYVKNYETYNKFSDMAGAGWAKGYIGYCANAALVKGYPNGTFLPSGKVTGYEVLAMILRAVGYDKNNEFTGADWALHVAQIAEQNKILKNVKGIDLSAPASRELVAELLFQAIQVPTVTYTAAFGYQDVSLTADKKTDKLVKANSSLGYKNFGLICGEDEDEWGRPTKVWANDVNESGKYEEGKDSAYATIAYKADASFQAATAQCDILKELGTKKDVKGDLIVNGQKLDAVTLKDVTAKVGAQGRQIEVYYKYNENGDTRVVMIDTFLAYVDGTAEAKFDKNGHMTTPYTMTLFVYDEDNDGTKVVLEDTDAAFAYEEGDYLLVNAYTKAVNDADKSGFVVTGKDQYVEIVGKAESFTGAQSKIWSHGNQHTVADKTYDDAYKFILDQTNADTTTYTWFLDQFGNLIGATKIDNSSYAVLKDIVWKDGKPGAAYATLVYMDGTEKEDVEVSYIDGIKDSEKEQVSGEVGDFVKEYSVSNSVEKNEMDIAGWPNVSASGRYNTYYEGLALFRVDTLKDGDVALEGYGVIDHENGVTLKKDASSIKLSGSAKINLNSNTQFLVRSLNDKDEWIYTPYSRNNLPDFADGTVEIYYYVGGDGYAKYVYVKNATLEEELGTHVFVPQGSYGLNVDKGIWEMDVVIDGAERTIRTSEKIAEYLSENTGKMFHVVFGNQFSGSYGYITEATLVNEEWDADGNQAVNHKGYDCDYITYYDLSKSEVTQIAKGIKAGTIYSPNSTHNWQITDKTVFIGVKGTEITNLDNVDLEDHDIWVIGSTEKGSYEYAKVVYVGEKLDKGVGLTVTADKGTVAPATGDDKEAGYDYVVTAAKDATSDKLTFKGDDANSVLLYDGNGKAVGSATVTTSKGDSTWNVTVWNEAATAHKDYKIKVEWPESSNDTSLKSASISETGAHPTALDVASITGNVDLATAAATPKHLDVTTGKQYNVSVAATSDAAKVEMVSAENATAAASALPATAPASATNVASAQVDGNTALNGGIVVVRVTAENGDVMYYVFSAAQA